MSSLVIFTESYPINQNETFLINELPYILSEFDTVIAVPMGAGQNPSVLKGKVKPNLDQKTNLLTMVRKKPLQTAMWLTATQPHKTRIFNLKHIRKSITNLKNHFNDAANLNFVLPKDAVFYSYWLGPWAASIAILKQWFRPTAKWITRVHAYDIDIRYSEHNYFEYRNEINKQINHVSTISYFAWSLFNKKKCNFRGTHSVNYLGVAKNEIAKIPQTEDVVVVSCSGLRPEKRVGKIMDLLSLLNLPIKWIHFGDGPEKEELLKLIGKKDNNIKVELMGHKPNEEVIAFYKNNAIDFFINTAWLEGIPYSMMEAGSFGIPLIAYDICGIPELVSDDAGILLQNNNTDEYNALLIKSFIEKGNTRKIEFRKKVKQTIDSKFNNSLNFKEFSKLIISFK